MKRLLSLILLIGSFACAMDAPRREQNYPAHIYIQQVIQDKIKEGKLKKPKDCSFDEAIKQLNKIQTSLRFGKDENYCLNHEEIKAREYTASIYNDLPILGNAFDQQIASLVQHDGHIKKLADKIVEVLPEITYDCGNPYLAQIYTKINSLHPIIYDYINDKIYLEAKTTRYQMKHLLREAYCHPANYCVLSYCFYKAMVSQNPLVTFLCGPCLMKNVVFKECDDITLYPIWAKRHPLFIKLPIKPIIDLICITSLLVGLKTWKLLKSK